MMVIMMMMIMMIMMAGPYDYHDDNGDNNDDKNDSYNAAGADPGAGVPCPLFLAPPSCFLFLVRRSSGKAWGFTETAVLQPSYSADAVNTQRCAQGLWWGLRQHQAAAHRPLMRPASTPSGRTPLVNGGNRKHRNGAQTGFLSDRDKQPEESPQRHGKSNGSGNKAGTVKAHRKIWLQLVLFGKMWFQLGFFW